MSGCPNSADIPGIAWGKHNPDWTAYRHGYQLTTIPMCNQRLAIERPRLRRTFEDQELPIPSYEAFANNEQLIKATPIILNKFTYG